MNGKHKLDKNGMYIIEDITNSDIKKWHNFKCIGNSFELIKLQNPCIEEDITIMIKKIYI